MDNIVNEIGRELELGAASLNENATIGQEESKKSLDLDELFGFSEARRRAEEAAMLAPEGGNIEDAFVPYRIFLNHIDSYHGKSLSRFLTDQVFGGAGSEPELGGEEEEVEEEEEEEGEEEEDDDDTTKKSKGKDKEKIEIIKHNYEIIGTVKDPNYQLPEDIKEIIHDTQDKEAFLEKIMKCGFIIYDITSDPSQISEALWVLQAIEKELIKLNEQGPKTFKKMKEVRCFILISTVMTWALTKPIDPDDPSVAFTEADFRKRKPHPNYKDHAAAEKEVVRIGKTFNQKLKTVVICSGITYGGEEDVLNFLFKLAWHNDPELPLFLGGKNRLPLFNVQDLTSLVHIFLESFPPSSKFILAVEQQSTRLRSVVKAVSTALSTGRNRKVSKEEAFLIPEMTQRIYDMVTVNLNMEPTYIMDNIEMKWASESTFSENIQQLVTEYREARGLKALKIYLHGPPAVGKTKIAKRLCEHYKLHYLNVEDVIAFEIAKMKETIERLKAKEKAQEEEDAKSKEEKDEDEEDEDEEEEEEEEEDEAQEGIEELTEMLEEVEANMSLNNGRPDEQFIIKFFKDRLSSNSCQNQGFVLDHYPMFMEEAKALFEAGDEEEETGEEEEGEMAGNKKTMPEFVISLEASDDFVIERVIQLPEKDVQGTLYAEEPLLKRLADFRANNTDENTVLNFFDELEVHPLLVNVENDNTPEMDITLQTIIDRIGKAKNFGPTLEELAEMNRTEEARKKEQEAEERRLAEERMNKINEERRKHMEEWVELQDKLKEEEESLLALKGMPERHYLMKYILPTLTRGIIEVNKVRPMDPVDYLAEFLFRENPEGKMFQPDHTEAAQELLNAADQFQTSLLEITSIPHLL